MVLFSEHDSDVYVFHGLTDQASEGTWVCDGTGEIIARAGLVNPLFVSGQPDNYGGIEHCAVSWRSGDFLLGDARCGAQYYYLCEKP